MGLTADIATRKETQVRLGVGLSMAILYGAVVIIQCIALDSVQRTPTYAVTIPREPVGPFDGDRSFPRFVVCPYSVNETSPIGDFTCVLTISGLQQPIGAVATSTHAMFVPTLGRLEFSGCRDVDMSQIAHKVSSSADYVRCTVSTETLTGVSVTFTDGNFGAVSENSFDWTIVARGSLAALGIREQQVMRADGSVLYERYSVQVQQIAAEVASDTLFSVQYTGAEGAQLVEFSAFSAWTFFGVIGGCAVLVYGLYVLLVKIVFQLLNIDAPARPDRFGKYRQLKSPVDGSTGTNSSRQRDVENDGPVHSQSSSQPTSYQSI